MPPVQTPILYNSWYECSRAAHQESIKIYSKLGYKLVNEYEVGMKYNCKRVAVYRHYGQIVLREVSYL